MENTATVASRGFPWAIIMVVALLIAKFGFGVQIAWLWVLAPLWIPFVIGIAILLVIALIFLIGLLLALAFDASRGGARGIRRR